MEKIWFFIPSCIERTGKHTGAIGHFRPQDSNALWDGSLPITYRHMREIKGFKD